MMRPAFASILTLGTPLPTMPDNDAEPAEIASDEFEANEADDDFRTRVLELIKRT